MFQIQAKHTKKLYLEALKFEGESQNQRTEEKFTSKIHLTKDP